MGVFVFMYIYVSYVVNSLYIILKSFFNEHDTPSEVCYFSFFHYWKKHIQDCVYTYEKKCVYALLMMMGYINICDWCEKELIRLNIFPFLASFTRLISNRTVFHLRISRHETLTLAFPVKPKVIFSTFI